MARKKKEKEKYIIDQMLDNIDFKGITQDEVVEHDGLYFKLTCRINYDINDKYLGHLLKKEE